MKTKDYRVGLLKRLECSEYASSYLTKVLENESSEAFLIALKDVTEARKENISSLAKRCGVSRQAIYQVLSKEGNPRFSTITQLLKALNLKFSGLKLATGTESKKKVA
ncbi:MAG: putative addiction module antidote protein [Proteobacteria bacterium]|nr:putative addiction module antidote protein [Pseudomonadota bacterium]